jgi:hypothetical protein
VSKTTPHDRRVDDKSKLLDVMPDHVMVLNCSGCGELLLGVSEDYREHPIERVYGWRKDESRMLRPVCRGCYNHRALTPMGGRRSGYIAEADNPGIDAATRYMEEAG